MNGEDLFSVNMAFLKISYAEFTQNAIFNGKSSLTPAWHVQTCEDAQHHVTLAQINYYNTRLIASLHWLWMLFHANRFLLVWCECIIRIIQYQTTHFFKPHFFVPSIGMQEWKTLQFFSKLYEWWVKSIRSNTSWYHDRMKSFRQIKPSIFGIITAAQESIGV